MRGAELRSAALLLCFSLLGLAFAEAPAPSEYEVKAAYILRFARYVHWPPTAFLEPSAPLVILVLGEDPFGPHLEAAISSAAGHERALQVRRADSAEAASPPHIAFFGGSSQDEHRRWLMQLRDQPVLTIAEVDSPVQQRTVLTFVTERRAEQVRVRFDVNLQAMTRAGLQIHSPMISSARRVIREPPDARSGHTP